MKASIHLTDYMNCRDRPLKIGLAKGRGFSEMTALVKANKTTDFFHFLDEKNPVYFDALNNVLLLKVRNKDLPWLLENGHIDAGIGSSIWFEEFNSPLLQSLVKLPLKKCRLSLITSTKKEIQEIKIVCTRFQNIARQYLTEKNVNATILLMDGCHETALYIGIADTIMDIIETGETIKRMGFTELTPIKEISHEVWIRPGDLSVVKRLQEYLIIPHFIALPAGIPVVTV